MLKLPETILNWSALMLLQEWEKQEKEHNYKVWRLRPLFKMLAGALSLEATKEVDTEQLELELEDGA